MKPYLDTLSELVVSPYWKKTRAKVAGEQMGTKLLPPQLFRHDLRDGFPLLTTKRVPLRLVASELEWFLSGSSRKEPLHAMKNHIWDEWHVGDDENELGRVYGVQWRRWLAFRKTKNNVTGETYLFKEIDQVQKVIDTLRTNPSDRRMIVNAWNPGEIDQMALPTCHVMWQINYYGVSEDHPNGLIGLHWTQRSCDYMLGVPFNIASYALLLLLVAKTVGMDAGPLSGTLIDCHIYDNHLKAADEQLKREPFELPKVVITGQDESEFDLFKWKYTDYDLFNYNCHPTIKMDVAV